MRGASDSAACWAEAGEDAPLPLFIIALLAGMAWRLVLSCSSFSFRRQTDYSSPAKANPSLSRPGKTKTPRGKCATKEADEGFFPLLSSVSSVIKQLTATF